MTADKKAYYKAYDAKRDKAKRNAIGRASYTRNKAAINENRRNKYAAGDRKRALAVYGLTPSDFEALFVKQEGKCAVKLCSKWLPFSGRGVHVDHNHATGKVRGLLCNHCNIGLGHFKESPDMLQSALDYLQERE